MKIKSLHAWQSFESNGFPVLNCRVILENNVWGQAAIPFGISKGMREAQELVDGGQYFEGRGVKKACRIIEEEIITWIIHQPIDVVNIDTILLELDGTEKKERLGANTILAVSIAVLKAQAKAYDRALYDIIAEISQTENITIPFPLFSIIEGGRHSDNQLNIQEFLLMPQQKLSFTETYENVVFFFNQFKNECKKKNVPFCYGIEGGLNLFGITDMEALNFLCSFMSEFAPDFKIGLDMAASQQYDPVKKLYNFAGKSFNRDQLIQWYTELVDNYPLMYLEDPFSQDDLDGWEILMSKLGQQIQIIGDDLFCTNPRIIYEMLEKQATNGVVIKPNQVGTVTETIQAIQVSQEHYLTTIVSHRSHDTIDTFIADLAVGTGANQIKAGGCFAAERIAKYNRLIEIEYNLE